jgi:ketosteroid isomerase-like protein
VSQENIDTVLRLLEANARRDWDELFEIYAPDIEWEDNSGLWGDWGTPRGHEELRDAWRRWFEVLGGVDWRIEGELVDIGDEVVATYDVHGRGRGSGVEVDQLLTLVWTVRDGRVSRVRAYRERDEALQALGVSG